MNFNFIFMKSKFILMKFNFIFMKLEFRLIKLSCKWYIYCNSRQYFQASKITSVLKFGDTNPNYNCSLDTKVASVLGLT